MDRQDPPKFDGAPPVPEPPSTRPGLGDVAPLSVRPPMSRPPLAPVTAHLSQPPPPPRFRPSYVFLAAVSILSLASDIASKLWAEKKLDGYPGIVHVWPNHIALVLARNKGGAWGLLQSTSENVRRPFFLLVSVAAIAFIVTLYRRLQPRQRALRWGLPLVLGGALGNVFDRIRYGHVIDFIDMHALWKGREHHWPTFNVADIAIFVGVGLMAIDMFTSKKVPPATAPAVVLPPTDPFAPPPSGNPFTTVDPPGTPGSPFPPIPKP
jgi:lipoprotein signal peptidase